MTPDLIQFLILFLMVVVADQLNRVFRRWCRALIDPFGKRKEKSLPFLVSLSLLVLAFNIAFIPVWLIAWVISFFI
jgi:hypothetical protein